MSTDARGTEALLVEIGTLELPARLLPGLSQSFADRLSAWLGQDGWIDESHGAATKTAFYTPRRLAVRISDIADLRPGQIRIQRGPTLAQAFDAQGQPQPAALGFAKSQGVSLEALTIESGRLIHRVSEPPVRLAERLPHLVEETLREIPADREMRWATGTPPFVRPIRSVLLLHGRTPVPGRVYGLPTGRFAQGHPIHHPDPVPINHPDEYESTLQAACVLLNRPGSGMLREHIWALIERSAQNWNPDWHPSRSAETLDEVSNLVEWPQAIAGSFPASFLDLPEPVIRAVLCGQQRVFPLADAAEHLAPGFVAIVNLESTDVDRVRAGEERVILPRLADALFFFEEDRHRPLAERAGELDGIIFEKRLGHLGLRRERLIRWMTLWSASLGLDPVLSREAAALVLCDLTTTLVREFPELAGEAGAHYARIQGSPDFVVQALREAYLPKTAEDLLPESALGGLLSLALRVDLLAGYFLVGEKPSGQRDPFALRRAAQGIVGILDPKTHPAFPHPTAGAPPLALETLFETALTGYLPPTHAHATIPALASELYDFTLDRLRARYLDEGGRIDAFEAVAALRPGTLADFRSRLDALEALAARPELATLIQMMKRVGHLLKKNPQDAPPANAPDTLSVPEPAEAELALRVADLESRVCADVAKGRYRPALESLLALEAPLATFFESVLVLTEDPSLRKQRLALLERIDGLLRSIADLERLQGA
ncbi:MAG: glycine--tRNA ligase subunit beta [Gammaproteobacteria bacterium]